MEALPYLLKVNICWAVFYGLYWMLFRRHTFFFLNRCYLLLSLLISFAIPAIEFQETIRVVESAPTVITTSDLTFVASVGNSGETEPLFRQLEPICGLVLK